MTVADRIKYLREKIGWTQDELAERMGYTSKSSISKIETSGNNITLKKIAKLAKVLNTSESYLMGWVSNPDPTYAETLKGTFERTSNQAKVAGKQLNEIKDAFLETQDLVTYHLNSPLEAYKVSLYDNTTPNKPEAKSSPSYNAEQIAEALELYSEFKSSLPQIQAAVRSLLKSQQPDV